MSDRSNNLTLLIGGAVAVAIAVALAVALAVGGGSDSSSKQQVAFVNVQGSALPPFEGTSGPSDPAIGQIPPSLRGANFDDERVEVNPGDGRPMVVGFFAHWCPHCQAELPRLSDWLNDDANSVPEGVDVIAVSTGVDRGSPNYPPSSWFDEEGWPEPIILDTDTNAAAQAWGLTGYPYFVVIDGTGAVIGRTSGELDQTQWETLLNLAATGAGDTSGLGGGESSQVDAGDGAE
ncbi:MAG: redoxin domain-containing protein [Acidimicrobiales bacterium]|nr:redoxin domain-containing protein [Acidimicrobiales bacterium]